MIVSVCGLIGSGKSTLVSNLSNHDGYIEFQEPVDTNPFLESYYKDPVRWSYAMQVNLLFERYKQTCEAFLHSVRGEVALLDSTIYSDMAFALVQKWSMFFTESEFISYIKMHKVIESQTAYPDIVFWLNLTPSQALERIAKRGRSCEGGIKLGYLESLNDAYTEVLYKLQKRTNVIRVDASQNAEAVYDACSKIIKDFKE